MCWFLDAGNKEAPHAQLTGVQKAPRHEVAGSWVPARQRAQWRFNAGADVDEDFWGDGATLHSTACHTASFEFELSFDGFKTTKHCHVVWRAGNTCGVEFVRPPQIPPRHLADW
jgi:hypothetical protein